jgi:large subunit ribosomal protein L19
MLKAQVKDSEINIGDTLRVHSNIVEGSKTRVQVFEGILIALNGRGENQMMTVRHIGTGGLGVEKKWPLNARSIVKVEVKKSGSPRRSKLYYLRELIGKRATRV